MALNRKDKQRKQRFRLKPTVKPPFLRGVGGIRQRIRALTSWRKDRLEPLLLQSRQHLGAQGRVVLERAAGCEGAGR